ncbi:SRPBCC family protein [Pseudomonas sp. CGJS7]|uniref:SRPBCC family protein n=1 Tax=Pseudomonas sp. CGJS7 TaxID=3109348 RepID=UPI003009A40F
MHAIEHIQYIKAPIERVFQALTTQTGMSEVWTSTCTVEPGPDRINRYLFGDDIPTDMQTVVWQPDQRLAWRCVASDETDWLGTEIHFDLQAQDGRVAVSLGHRGWRELGECYRFCNYNWAMFLYSLKSYCEHGAGLPYQRRMF